MKNRVMKYWVGAVIAIAALSVPVLLSGCLLGTKESARIVHKGPGTPFDLQGFIDQALAAGQKRVVVPPGRYRVKPQHCCHLRLRDLQDVEIFDQKTETLKRGVIYCAPKPFESLGQRRYRLAKPENYQYNPDADKEEVGDILVTNSNYSPGGSAGHAIVSSDCKNLVLEDIRLYASNCFSYLEYNCDGTTYRRCSIDRRPLAEDLQPRGLRRLRSSNADAFHSKHAVRGPQIIGCTAKWQGDDCVNICGEYYMIMGSNKNSVRILATRDINLKVVAIGPDGTVKAEEPVLTAKK